MKPLFLGLGKVNLSIASFFEGEKIALVEDSKQNEVQVLRALNSGSFEETDRIPGSLDSSDFPWKKFLPARVFISPGIDPRRTFFGIVKDWEERELDFFSERFKGISIAITGTDGKSTFTSQLGEVLKRALPNQSSQIFVGGNLGNPLLHAVHEKAEIAVLEVSSFQCERLKKFEPEFGILLNLDRDHLDRYDQLEDYFRAKWSLLQRSKNIFYPLDLTPPWQERVSAAKYSNFSELREILKKVVETVSKFLNFDFSDSLFENLPRLRHRQETYADSEGRIFVNDSKATTVHSSLYALKIFQSRFSSVQIILGGKGKGDAFERYLEVLRPTDVVLIYGAAKNEIEMALKPFKGRIESFSSLAALMEKTLSSLPPKSCLVLSPACASYDEFKNFEERGDFFIQKVRDRFQIHPTDSLI